MLQEWEDTDIHTICMGMASLNTAEAMVTDIMVDMAMVMADTGMATARVCMVMDIIVDMAKVVTAKVVTVKVATVKAGMVSKGN